MKPEQNKGRIFILSFMRSHRSDPQVLNNVEMVGYKDWTGPIDITHSEWRYTAADIPDAGTAKVNCTYKAVVFNKALLEQAIRQQVEATKQSLLDEMAQNPAVKAIAVTLGMIAGGPILGAVVKYLLDVEGKSLHQKVRERMPALDVNPDVYLTEAARSYSGTGTWKYVDPSHIAERRSHAEEGRCRQDHPGDLDPGQRLGGLRSREAWMASSSPSMAGRP